MLLFLLLLLVCSSQATHFFGTVMTYNPKGTSRDGRLTVVIRYKLNFHLCSDSDTWSCITEGQCGTQSAVELNRVDEDRSGEWCQREGIMTRQVSSSASFQLLLDGRNWINNIVNGIRSWRAVTLVELRNRSDTGRANRSPQTTILPALRVPSNCRRDFNLLAFDPDEDEIKCRYGDRLLFECNPCTPPSVLRLSSSCSLSFSPTSSSDEGAYAVQLVMEDFPRQTITLNQISSSREVKTPNDTISKIPVQFVVRVDPVVRSCTEGLYLPRFLPPTPANRAQLYTPVNQSLDISIKAEANISRISELQFSGPYNINQTRSGPGQFTLSWTPSESEDGESSPICFVVQAVYNSTKYHSELRCVIVRVGNDSTIHPTTTPGTTLLTTPGITPETTLETTPGITPETSLETTPGITPETTLETTPGITPETSLETTPGITLLTTPGITPETSLLTTPGITPGITLLTTPGITPETSLETTPGITLETTPETTPGITPLTTPGITPETSLETTPGITPLTTPGITPETSLETTPGITPGITPETSPGTTPEITPEITPGITPGTTLETTPGITPLTTPGITPETSLETTPGITLETTPETTPGTTPGITLETTPASQQIVARLTVRIASLFPLSENDIRNTITQLKGELVKQGLPLNITLSYLGTA
ncbi:mucin-2-like [Seriola aureovittata]|uniref:mucin-2-like n=1 Tax=Seriola aureovittata TaxID=2871759 RepID=UPI0024BE6588|nr:mucin-2-like [Seriola aureovittata]